VYIYPFEREEQDKLTALSPPYQGIFRGIAMELEFRPNEIKFGMEEKRRELKRQVGNQVRLLNFQNIEKLTRISRSRLSALGNRPRCHYGFDGRCLSHSQAILFC